MLGELPGGSRYLMLEDSGPPKTLRIWLWGSESLNIGYLDPLGRLSISTSKPISPLK